MLDTFSLLTIELARAYGAGIVIAALAALLMPARMTTVFADLERSPALVFLSALFAIVLGLVMIVLHSLWTDFPAALVSLLGWAVIAKGIVLLAAPEGIMKLAGAFTPAHIRLWGVIVLILGAVYLAIGLTGHAAVS
ncbi:MAG: hypothetical protein QM773_20030 [Hyphomonadaceae bacterium]